MAPKKNPRAAALEKKAANQAEKDAKQRQLEEERSATEWSMGSKGKTKKDLDAEKKAAIAARKAENAALLAAEESTIAKSKAPSVTLTTRKSSESLRGSAKVAARREEQIEKHAEETRDLQTFAASNIDDALELMDHVTTPTNSGRGRTNGPVERHPERRAKTAYISFEERMLPMLKEENPSLRLSQLKEMLWKLWQKSPENPFNQSNLSYRASKEEEKELIEKLQKDTEERLRIK